MNTLDPQIAAELDALEAALNGEPTADPALVALVEDVRATAAPMPLGLKTRLEERVEAGFPRERKQRGERHLPRWALPAMGAAASVLIALVVFNGARDSGTQGVGEPLSSADGDSTAKTLAAPSPGRAGGAAGSGTVAADEAAPGTALPQESDAKPVSPSQDTLRRDRKVEKAVELTLRVGAGQLEDAADGVVRTTQRLGGYVADSQVSARGRGGSATFTLRIPTKRLDTATSQLSKLGHVTRLDQSSRDITSAFVSVEEQLSDARAERRALLRALGKATTPAKIASLRERIRLNRSEIAQYKGQLNALRRRADLATISVEIVARGKASAAPGSGDDRWSPGDAAKDALRVLEVAAGVLVIAIAIAAPLALLGGLTVLGGRSARRRRREHALDAG
jgi:hypothetical protein